MKKLYLVLFGLFSLAYSQVLTDKPLLITEPGEYTLEVPNWIREDSCPVYILTTERVIIKDSYFHGIGFAFISTDNRKQFKDDVLPQLTVIRSQFIGAKGAELSAGNTLPWTIEAGGGNTAGINDLQFLNNYVENCGGVRWKKSQSGATGRIIGNHFVNINGAVSDGAGGWLDQKQAERLTGIPSSQYTRHGLSIGRLFSGPVKDILIEWNFIDNRNGTYQTDVVNVSGNVDLSTVIIGPDGIPVSSGLTVRNNCVIGNYHLYWYKPGQVQPGCSYIYDNQTKPGYGGALFQDNYSIAGSNTAFQHAAYGVGYWDRNTAINSGYRNDTLVTYCGRGFGLFHKNQNLPVSQDIRFTRNKAAYNNTRRGVKRLDFSLWKSGGGEYPEKFFVWNGPAANIHLQPDQLATKELEDFYINEFLSKAAKAGYDFSGGGVIIDPPSLPDCKEFEVVITELREQIEALKIELRASELERLKLTAKIESAIKILGK